jgi:triacylglycerol lipase
MEEWDRSCQAVGLVLVLLKYDVVAWFPRDRYDRDDNSVPMRPQQSFARLDAPIVLAHGLGGFSRIGVGPVTLATYFRGIPEAMASSGNQVLVTRVPPLAGVDRRAHRLGEQIEQAFDHQPVHLIGHSMGGLDCRHLLTDPAWRKHVLSLTTIGSPHLGSWLADFAKLRVGRIYRLLERMGVDPSGCLDVTRGEARRFHDRHPAPSDLPCFSVAGEPAAELVCWPLRRFHAILSELDGLNDGLVSTESAQAFGTPLPVWPVDHLRQMNWLVDGKAHDSAPQPLELYAQVIAHLASLGFGREVSPDVATPAALPAPAPVIEGPTSLAG